MGRLIFSEYPAPEDLNRYLTEKAESVATKGPANRVGWSTWITMADGTKAHFSGFRDAPPAPSE